jgi:Large polyvalent protein-associated domain 7
MAGDENSIQQAKRRRKGPARPHPDPIVEPPVAAESQENPSKSKKRSKPAEVPEEVRKRFVQVGKHFHYPDGKRAFTDRGDRLSTPSENTEVIRSLVQIAKAREWSAITVQGTERFRKESWLAGRAAGLEVAGYQPTDFEAQRLAKLAANSKDAQPSPKSPRRPRSPPPDELIVGRLLDHGRAKYKNSQNQPLSYFVKLETPRGERTVWGVDLERAMRESLSRPQVGDEVGLRAVAQEPVKIRAGETSVDAHRNRWIIEKRQFLEQRAEAAKVIRDGTDLREAMRTRPELAGTFLQLHVAQLVAKKRLNHPEDRKQFLARVRATLADAIQRGEPLPAMRLRDKPTERLPPEREREPGLAR